MTRDAREERLTKGERTRRRILATAAELFNVRGYHATAVTDVADAVGLEKGAVYNYFTTKDALALAAFDHNAATVLDRIAERARTSDDPLEALLAMLAPYRAPRRPILMKGGCPLLNTAIEATDTHPALRERARRSFAQWRSQVEAIVACGVSRGIFRSDVRPASVASMVVASLEGGIMLARVARDPARLSDVVDQIEHYLRSLTASAASLR